MNFNGATFPPTLTLGPTSANTISPGVATFTYQVIGTSIMTGGATSSFKTVAVTIYNRCYTSTVVVPGQSVLP